jgi:hypothetical protein
MQNREELRQKGKVDMREKYFSEGGGGINIIFGPKYRPLLSALLHGGS